MPATHDNLPPVGADCVLAYNTGTHATPVWAEIKNAIDVAVGTLAHEDVDASSRASGWKMSRAGLTEAELTFDYRYYGGTDAVFAALLAAFRNRTPLQLFVCDGPTNVVGNKGWRMYVQLMSAPVTQNLADSQVISFSCKPTPFFEGGSLIEPDFYTVAA